ncbi:hypothetical protein [Nonomuraea sp. NPDC049400]|uniref:hypothetical protein n=1 Tax=Nonomuraea sp. NPDC049400 TaxID=3364352 RepID=UPI0037AE3759
MRSAWRQVEGLLHDLAGEVDGWSIAQPAPGGFRSPVERPSPDFVAAAGSIPDTSFVLWDGARLEAHVRQLQQILVDSGIALSVGLKACANVDVLRLLARCGIYADAQSMGECDLAEAAGFGVLTATGPAFRPADVRELLSRNVLFDAQSVTQIDQLRALNVRSPVGLRIRVRLPDPLRHPDMRHSVSRFGIELSEDSIAQVGASGLDIGRLRVHTGEALSADVARTLEYRALLGVALAGLFGSVNEINLGGGFLALSRDLPALRKAMERVGAVFEDAERCLDRPLHRWVEPGSALLLDSAYLISEVLDVDRANHAVTIAASPWNLAPWAFSTVFVLSGTEHWEFRGDVYGPALYENDRLRRTERYRQRGRLPNVGDRIAISSFGAYTLVHGRTFGQIPLPPQYLFGNNTYKRVT